MIAAPATVAAAPARPAAAAPAAQAAPSLAVPDLTVVHKLVWSTMAAIDQANQTGNYSVLRDLGAPSFQEKNTAATLAGTFSNIRNLNLDLGYALVTTPVFQFPPAIASDGLLRVRGIFPLRPYAVGFDMLFQNVGGQWRIFGIFVAPVTPKQAQTPAH